MLQNDLEFKNKTSAIRNNIVYQLNAHTQQQQQNPFVYFTALTCEREIVNEGYNEKIVLCFSSFQQISKGSRLKEREPNVRVEWLWESLKIRQ